MDTRPAVVVQRTRCSPFHVVPPPLFTIGEESRGTIMKKMLNVMALCFAVALLSGFFQASSAAVLNGSVKLNGQAASALVVAVPYNPETHQILDGQAVAVPTDAAGKFHLTAPSEHYLLAAWDGQNGVVVDSPTNMVALTMTKQGPPQYQTVSDCKYQCSCVHFVGNLFWVFLWGNGWLCGNYQYLSWGCHC